MGADYLAYALLDAVVDFYFTILEKFGDKIEALEENLLNNPSRLTVHQLHDLKREMIFVRKAAWPIRELINNMQRSETELIKPTTDIYLRDVHDHSIRVVDTVETYRDLLSSMMDIYLSSMSNKMNEVMKVMAIVTCLLAPATVIGGIFGMNFEKIPLLHNKWGFFISVGLMLFIPLAMVRMFNKRGWFKI
jgi:magnesium transporter